MESAMAHTPVDKKIGVDRALTLFDKMKAMLAKMVAAEEAKRAAYLLHYHRHHV
jgi:hypothetical protein